MALVSLFFSTKAKLGSMELDASLSETHEATAQLSKNEIQDGSCVSDNIILDPKRLTIEATISKTPLGISALAGSAVTAALGKVPGLNGLALAGAASIGGLVTSKLDSSAGGVISDGNGGIRPATRSPEDVFSYLLELRDRKTPFAVVTALRSYEDMVFTSISTPRNSTTTGELRFTATMEQVRFVRAIAVTTPLVAAGSVANGAGKAENLGKQAATSASSKTADQGTIAFRGLKALQSLFGGG